MKITDFLVLDSDGNEIRADAHGNNVAFCCARCGFPILVVALENQRGSDEDDPAACNGCRTRYFLDVRESAGKLYIHHVGRQPN
jgi:DNA-directed RNA polymerase subunit RPC12/RpoP